MDGYTKWIYMLYDALWRQSYVYSSQYDVSLRHGYDTLPLHDVTLSQTSSR